MKTKQKIRMLIDILMLVSLPALMAYELIGTETHEWIGIFMGVLFITHHVLNIAWFKKLFKGKYTINRCVGTCINIILFIFMCTLMISGIMMSRHVFIFLGISFGQNITRTLHLVAAYWSFVFMSFHVGLHGAMLLKMIKKLTKTKKASKQKRYVWQGLTMVLALYGIYAFFKQNLWEYLFLRTEFVFFDFTVSRIFFFMDYLAIMFLFSYIGYYVSAWLMKLSRKQK